MFYKEIKSGSIYKNPKLQELKALDIDLIRFTASFQTKDIVWYVF